MSGEPERRLEALTARETLALPEPAADARLLGEYVGRGYRTVIGGATGHGKSTLTAAIVSAILSGSELLGETGAGIGPALWLDLEQGLRSIKRMLREAGLADRDDLFVVRAPDGLSLDAEDRVDLAELERVIAEVRPAVFVLDPLYKAHRVEANEERPIVDLMRRLDALREHYGFALILPAHVRKDQGGSNGARKLTLDDVAGSGAITRGAEVALAIERIVHGFARVRILKDREGGLVVGEALDLTYSKDNGFRLKPKEDPEAKAHDVCADGEWRTLGELAQALGCRNGKARELADRLVEAGCFEVQIGPPGRSSKARCYRLSTVPVLWEQSGTGEQSSGQARHCSHCARVLLGRHGHGTVVGEPRETVPGAVDPDDEARWRSLLDEAAPTTCAVDDCRAAPVADSPSGLCWSHEQIRRERAAREATV